MRLGINTFLFTFPFTNQSTEWFTKFKKWGYDSVEIAIDDPDAISAQHIKSELDKNNLVCGTICGVFGPNRDLRGTIEEQKECIAYIEKVFEIMQVLKCNTLVGPMYSAVGRANAETPSDYEMQWQTVKKNLTYLAKKAEQKGIILAIEPLNRFETDFINTVDQVLKLINEIGSNALKIHLDTFHMNIEEKSQSASIIRAGKHLAHLHACGSDRGIPGNDSIDWPGIKKALLQIGYNKDIVIESFTQDVKAIARAAAIWRKIETNNEEIATKGISFLKKTFA